MTRGPEVNEYLLFELLRYPGFRPRRVFQPHAFMAQGSFEPFFSQSRTVTYARSQRPSVSGLQKRDL